MESRYTAALSTLVRKKSGVVEFNGKLVRWEGGGGRAGRAGSAEARWSEEYSMDGRAGCGVRARDSLDHAQPEPAWCAALCLIVIKTEMREGTGREKGKLCLCCVALYMLEEAGEAVASSGFQVALLYH